MKDQEQRQKGIDISELTVCNALCTLFKLCISGALSFTLFLIYLHSTPQPSQSMLPLPSFVPHLCLVPFF